jgi:hypothetical protein
MKWIKRARPSSSMYSPKMQLRECGTRRVVHEKMLMEHVGHVDFRLPSCVTSREHWGKTQMLRSEQTPSSTSLSVFQWGPDRIATRKTRPFFVSFPLRMVYTHHPAAAIGKNEAIKQKGQRNIYLLCSFRCYNQPDRT